MILHSNRSIFGEKKLFRTIRKLHLIVQLLCIHFESDDQSMHLKSYSEQSFIRLMIYDELTLLFKGLGSCFI